MEMVERAIERVAGRYISERISLAVKENDATWRLLYDRAGGPSDLPWASGRRC